MMFSRKTQLAILAIFVIGLIYEFDSKIGLALTGVVVLLMIREYYSKRVIENIETVPPSGR